MAASVPSTSASPVATVATINELTTASRTAGLLAASPNQRSVKSAGGQAWIRLELKAYITSIASGR